MQCSIKREIRKQVSKGYLKMYIEVRENIFRKNIYALYKVKT